MMSRFPPEISEMSNRLFQDGTFPRIWEIPLETLRQLNAQYISDVNSYELSEDVVSDVLRHRVDLLAKIYCARDYLENGNVNAFGVPGFYRGVEDFLMGSEDPEYVEWLDFMMHQMEIFKFILTRFPNIGDTLVSRLRTPSEVDL